MFNNRWKMVVVGMLLTVFTCAQAQSQPTPKHATTQPGSESGASIAATQPTSESDERNRIDTSDDASLLAEVRALAWKVSQDEISPDSNDWVRHLAAAAEKLLQIEDRPNAADNYQQVLAVLTEAAREVLRSEIAFARDWRPGVGYRVLDSPDELIAGVPFEPSIDDAHGKSGWVSLHGDTGVSPGSENVAWIPSETLVAFKYIRWDTGISVIAAALDYSVACQFEPAPSYRTLAEEMPRIVADALNRHIDAESIRGHEIIHRFYEQHFANATELGMRRDVLRLITGAVDVDDLTLSELCYNLLLLYPALDTSLGPYAPVFELCSGDVVVWVSFAESDILEDERVIYDVFVRERWAYRVDVLRRRAMYGKRLERKDLAPGWQDRLAAIHRSLLTQAFKLNEMLEYWSDSEQER
jgi:hypothetical protein